MRQGLAALPQLGSNLSSFCLSFSECWDNSPGPPCRDSLDKSFQSSETAFGLVIASILFGLDFNWFQMLSLLLFISLASLFLPFLKNLSNFLMFKAIYILPKFCPPLNSPLCETGDVWERGVLRMWKWSGYIMCMYNLPKLNPLTCITIRAKKKHPYKNSLCTNLRMTEFSSETIQTRKQWNNSFSVIKDKNPNNSSKSLLT